MNAHIRSCRAAIWINPLRFIRRSALNKPTGSCLIAVPDPDSLYRDFAVGLRAIYGKLPVRGIPRMLRPRKKYGTVRGFSIVDPGGNWLRIHNLNDTEAGDSPERAEGLAQIILVAARLGDAHGNEAAALKTLENGLARYAADASTMDLARGNLYRAELAARLNNLALARSSLDAVKALSLTGDEKAAVSDELAYVEDLIAAEPDVDE